MSNISLLGFNISSKPAKSIILEEIKTSKVSVINTINAHSYYVQLNDKVFSKNLKESDILIPDGSGIAFAAYLNGSPLKKLPGFEFFLECMKIADERSYKVFFLGSSNEVLSKIKNKIFIEFPNISFDAYSPSYKTTFSNDDIDLFSKKINNFNPDIVFTGLTAPKQEKLANSLKRKISSKMIVNIGAVFDFYAGNMKRPNKLFLFLHLEWLGRFLKEPIRLFSRIFISMPIFITIILYKWLKNDLS